MRKPASLILTAFVLLSLLLLPAGCSSTVKGPVFSSVNSAISANEISKDKDGLIRFRFKAEEPGYYDLTIKGTPGGDSEAVLSVDDKYCKTVDFKDTGGSAIVTLWLDKGINRISFGGKTGGGRSDVNTASFKFERSSHKITLIIAPHEDDEVLGFAGTIQQTIARGDIVKVLFLTNGDYFGEYLGPVRIVESIKALEHLGVSQSDVIVMGYGDMLLETFFSTKETKKVCTAKSGRTETSGNPGIGIYDYHFINTGTHASYTADNFKKDLYDIIRTYRPSEIYTTHELEWHPDHKASYSLTDEAIRAVKKKFDYHPVLKQCVIHGEELTWPERLQMNADGSYVPSEFTDPFPSGEKPFDWAGVTKIKLTEEQIKNKYDAIKEFITQNDGGEGFKGNSEGNFAFVKTDEFFTLKEY